MSADRWTPAVIPPYNKDASEHFALTVLGVVDDPMFRMPGEDPFVDVVAYWPALKCWTVTHQVRSDLEADDHPVRVTFWMPLPALPMKEKLA